MKKVIERLKRVTVLLKFKRWVFGLAEKFFKGLRRLKWYLKFEILGQSGLSKVLHDPELIVSLTSFPARIDTVDRTIRSLLSQTEKPDKVILWLAEEQFPEKEKNLPKRLLTLKRNGLSIGWYHDIKSFKKLIPALVEYPESIIVTADDDIYYPRNWLHILYQEYKKNPSYIQAHIITEFSIKEGKYEATGRKHVRKPRASYLYKLVGCGGVLYPPKCFYPDVIEENKFMSICATNDDIWFWLMAVLNGIKVNVPLNNISQVQYVENTQEGPTLSSNNDRGEGLFWIQFKNMLDQYPSIDRFLKEEYKVLMRMNR